MRQVAACERHARGGERLVGRRMRHRPVEPEPLSGRRRRRLAAGG
jgi:hypothetical protein